MRKSPQKNNKESAFSMKQRLIYLLKHNHIAQMLYRTLGSMLLRLIGLFVKTDPHLVLFLSLMGTRYNDSPRAIYEYMKDREAYRDYLQGILENG